jgi:hypothetical protein
MAVEGLASAEGVPPLAPLGCGLAVERSGDLTAEPRWINAGWHR